MRYLPIFILLGMASPLNVQAQSTLLESVKRNPEEAIAFCKKFQALNERGLSATSEESIKEIARTRNLTAIDAEILATYVIGLNCPDVR